MSPENQFSGIIASLKEQGEMPIASHAAYISGVFEVSGGMIIEISSYTKKLPRGDRTYVYSYPLVSYSDNRLGKIEAFKQTFGGFVRQGGSSESYKWSLKGQKAVETAMEMEPFSPSRTEIIAAFQNWINAETPEERLEIARDVQ